MAKPLHEVEPGEYSDIPPEDRGPLEALIGTEVRRWCALFDESGNEAALWRAWRTARSLGDVPPAMLELLAPRLDQLAAAERNEKRVQQLSDRYWKLQAYYTELTRLKDKAPDVEPNKTAARAVVAKWFNTSEGAIKQLIMEFEGRGQRGQKA